MSGIKVPIDADLSGLKKAFDDVKSLGNDLNRTLSGGKVKVDDAGAKKTLTDLTAATGKLHDALTGIGDADIGDDALSGMAEQLTAVTKQADAMKAALGSAGKEAAAGFERAAAASRKLLQEMERARRLEAIAKREGLRLPGGAAAAEKDWSQRSAGSRRFAKHKSLADYLENWNDGLDEVGARRRRRDVLRSMNIQEHGGGGAGGRSFSQFASNTFGRAGSSVMHAALPNMGVGGSIMSSAVQEAAATEGGMMSAAGLGRLGVGAGVGALAFGAVKGIGAIKGKINSTEEESIVYTDLKRTLGSTADSFEVLRDSVRKATDGMGIAYAESAQLAMKYARGAGVDGLSGKQLHGELQGAYGLSRGLGLDPSAGVDFFASMRHNKASGGDTDNRRIALMLADAIGRAGVFTKADDVLQAVSSFTAQATRASFGAANVSGYTSGLGGLMGLGLPGMDPSAAASLLGKADGAIRGGGGQAQQNFFLGQAQQVAPDMDATEIGYLHDAGAFGSFESAYGRKSAAYQMASSRGDKSLMSKYDRMAAAGGSVTNIDRLMDGAEKNGAGTSWVKENMKGLFGFSDSEAAAMMMSRAKNGTIGNQINSFQSRYDIDAGSLNTKSIGTLALMENGTREDRDKQAKYLRSLNGATPGSRKLSKEESEMLSAAQSTPGADDAEYKKALIKISATRDTEANAGETSRNSLANIDNATAALATQLIPISTAIRNGIVALAEKMAPDSDFSKQMRAEREKQAGFEKEGQTKIAGATAAFEIARARGDGPGMAAAQLDINKITRELRGDSRSANGGEDYQRWLKSLSTTDGESSAGPVPDGAAVAARNLGGNSNLGVNVKPYTAKQVAAYAAKTLAPSPEYDDILRKAAAEAGVSFTDLKARAVQESGLNANAVGPLQKDGKQSLGLMQIEKGNLSRMGVSDPMDPLQNARAGARLLKDAQRQAGGDPTRTNELYYAGLPQNIGPNSRQYGANADAVRQEIARQRGLQETQVPAGGQVYNGVHGAANSVMFHGQHEITLKYPDGSPAAEPTMLTSQGSPRVAGWMGQQR